MDTVAQRCLVQMELINMLVLSRRLGEKIRIGDNIWITVVDIDRGKIRLGIEAPNDVPVHRKELLDSVTGKPIAVNRNSD